MEWTTSEGLVRTAGRTGGVLSGSEMEPEERLWLCNNLTLEHGYEHNPCRPPPPWLGVEFVLVVCIGGATAALSIVENAVLLSVFLSKAHLLSSYFFLTVLAGLDVLMGSFYLVLMVSRVLSEYLLLEGLNAAWYAYVVPLFTVSHIVMTSSAFLLIFATVERWRGADSLNKFPFTQRQRVGLAALAIAIGSVIKGTLYLEFVVVHIPACRPCNRVAVSAIANTDLVHQNHLYSTVWMFWFRNIAVVFLPFFALSYLNLCIVAALRRQSLSDRGSNLASAGEMVLMGAGGSERVSLTGSTVGARVRDSTRMLFIVTSSYLVANLINVLITAWEHIDVESLMSGNNSEFYHLGADVVSLLTIVAGAVRLPSYSWCNAEIRAQLRALVCRHRPKTRNRLSGSALPLTLCNPHRFPPSTRSALSRQGEAGQEEAVHQSAKRTMYERERLRSRAGAEAKEGGEAEASPQPRPPGHYRNAHFLNGGLSPGAQRASPRLNGSADPRLPAALSDDAPPYDPPPYHDLIRPPLTPSPNPSADDVML